MYKKILCPVDGSEASRNGVTEAIRLAKTLQAQLRFLHVVDIGAMVMYMPLSESVFETLRESGKEIIAEAMAAARAQGVEAESQMVEIMQGRVAPVIVDEAEKYAPDLIVMGTHGRRGLSRMLLGSDAAGVIGTSSVPVLLVK